MMASQTRTEAAPVNLLAARALNAKINGEGNPELARHALVEAVKAATGMSENMLTLLRVEGILP